MMEGPIDHIAFRVEDLEKTLAFYLYVMGLEIADRFEIDFDDGTKANCAALNAGSIPIFDSEGVGEGGVVKEWVKEHCNALHHVARSVDDIHATVERVKARGIAFLSDDVLEDANLLQMFTRPHPDTGIVHEIIQRKGNKPFRTENAGRLMESTR